MDYFQMAYTALGGLGIFFLGMKFLSESLQAMSGDLIKNLITKATSNRIAAVIVGLAVTMLIQSSSITTVMVVGLVGAELMTLLQAVGVILGANIGTTITGWILAVKIGKYGLLLIGLGVFPMLFVKKQKLGAIGKAIVSLGFIFLGLEFMSGAFKPLRTDPDFIRFLQYFHAQSFLSIIGCVVMGCLLTFIIQSSSAMLGITIALASTGSISFATAAALVLGENIGTTITAQLASIGGTTDAKRAAVSHSCFNILGVAVILLIFPYYLSLIDYLIPGSPDELIEGSKPYIAAHIAAGHTIFNVSATLLFLPFLQHLVRFVTWLVPDKGTKETPHLKYLRSGGISSSGVAIKMAFLELENMAQIVDRMLVRTRKYLLDSPEEEVYDKVLHLEQVTDNIQKEMTAFICQAMEGDLLVSQTSEAYSLIRAADELESIADHAESLCRYRSRLLKNQQDFSEPAWQQLGEYFDQTYKLYHKIVENIQNLRNKSNIKEYHAEAKALSKVANELRDKHIERMREKTCNPLSAMTFSDIVVALRRIKNHSINFVEAMVYQASDLDKQLEREETPQV